MAKNATYELSDLMKALKNLPKDQQQDMVSQIMQMMQSTSDNNNCNTLVTEHSFKNEKPNCPHCHAKAKLGFIVKKGKAMVFNVFFANPVTNTFSPRRVPRLKKPEKALKLGLNSLN